MKKFVSIFIMTLIMLQVSFAQNNQIVVASTYDAGAITSAPTEGNASPHELFGGSSNAGYALFQNFAFITNMGAGITNNSDGTITMNSSTYTNQKVATLGAGVQLQRWDGSNWINESIRYNASVTSDYMVFAQKTVTITKGYYYRTKSFHWAQNGMIEEDSTHLTDYIYVGN